MTIIVALILLTPANQGYWFGGGSYTVTIQPAAEAVHPATELAWQLRFAEAVIAEGTVPLAPEGPTVVQVQPPVVRARIRAQWRYELSDAAGRTVEEGTLPVHLFPTDLLERAAARLEGRRLLVWDAPQGLAAVLEDAGISHRRIESLPQLQLAEGDILLVGPDQIGPGPMDQSPLIGLAAAGASVMIFEQRRPPHLAGYDLLRRAAPDAMSWREDHLLFSRFEAQDLQSWLDQPDDLWAIQLPADEPALELAWWPVESKQKKAHGPIDALLVTKRVGSGRIVLSQLPVTGWQDDPRAQLLLRNALDYLASRPEPTPRTSDRIVPEAEQPAAVPTIRLP